jgi:glycerol kinase
VKVDGGMAENQWFLQNLSDICNITISKSFEKEATSLGAAIVSGIGSKNISNFSEFEKNLTKYDNFNPCIDKDLRENIIFHWDHAVKQTIGMVFK